MLFDAGASTVSRYVGRATTPEEAIQRAVADRVGGVATVTITSIKTDVSGGSGLQAQPDPSGRVGQPMRFVLVNDGVRTGSAIATVQVHTIYARAARAIARDEVVAPSAIELVDGELPSMPLRRVPSAQEIVGLKARRDIAEGEALTSAVLVTPPVVQSGDEVSVTVTLGRVEVTGRAVASGSGQVGDIIRVMQPHSRRLVKARITGPGAVEVVE